MTVGRFVLGTIPRLLAEVGHAAFDATNYVTGISPSPDLMLQGRLFFYSDAHRSGRGMHHTQLPVNRPHAAQVHNYSRDGFMRFDASSGREKNHEPNSFSGPIQLRPGSMGTDGNPRIDRKLCARASPR